MAVKMDNLHIIFYIEKNFLSHLKHFNDHLKNGRIYAEIVIGKHITKYGDGYLLINSCFPVYNRPPREKDGKTTILNISKLQLKSLQTTKRDRNNV